MAVRPAAGGGRWLEIAPERLARWLDGFDERHEVRSSRYTADLVTFDAVDGAVAECHPPFPPMGHGGDHDGCVSAPLVEHATQLRTVGVLLARLGGHAVGIFNGDELLTSKVGSRQVHGRSSAGGWSQQRFARRREGQVNVAGQAAADVAARLLVPWLAAGGGPVVLGGDRRAVQPLRDDPRLAAVFAAATDRFLTTPDPRLAVLREVPRQFRAVRIRLVDP
jgi:hypothetical protein